MFFLFLLAMIPILWLVIALSVFEDARAQSLFPCVGPDSTVIHVLLEISGREYGNGNAGRC